MKYWLDLLILFKFDFVTADHFKIAKQRYSDIYKEGIKVLGVCVKIL